MSKVGIYESQRVKIGLAVVGSPLRGINCPGDSLRGPNDSLPEASQR